MVFRAIEICIYLGIRTEVLLSELLSDLRQAIYDAVSENVPENNIAVAFSGGLDSSLLAKVCQDLGKQITLMTVGFADSLDIRFSKEIAAKMGLKQNTFEIDHRNFQNDSQYVRGLINCGNISHIENCIAYFYISRLAKQNGLNVMLSANGCDELFCGYSSFRIAYNNGEVAIMKMMDEKIVNEFDLMQEIAVVAREFGMQVRQPFLTSKFIEFAKTIPIDQKIKGSDDMKRKHILREVAILIGIPEESAMKPKKALQYGSSIHRYFKKLNK